MNLQMLLRVELLKVRKRSTFFVLFFGALATALVAVLPDHIIAIRHGEKSPVVFPHVWRMLVTGPSGPLVLMLAAISIIITIASEFTWKTARQNVIDGLSKNEWFVAKVVISIMFCFAFAFVMFVTGAVVAALNPFDHFVRGQDLRMLVAFFSGLFGYASAALFFSFLVRKDGGAFGLLFVLQGFGEPLFAFLLSRIRENWMSVLNYLPFHAMMNNLSPKFWSEGSPLFSQNLGLTYAYTALFLGLAYWNYRARDL